MRSGQAALRRSGNAWLIRGRITVRGRLTPAADKSLMHRALILAALAKGTSSIVGRPGEDVLATAQALRQLGIKIDRTAAGFEVRGRGLYGLCVSRQPIDCGNSGTTMRLLAGLLAAQPFSSTLTGDASLLRRPMQRLVDPLRAMGANVETVGAVGRPPLHLGRPPTSWLKGLWHDLSVDSAQVRTAILLAGLYAQGATHIRPLSAARDHTQRMLTALGVPVVQRDGATQLQPIVGPSGFAAFQFVVPGDASSAAFAIALASAIPGANLQVADCGLNPGRIRYLEVLQRAGAHITTAQRTEHLGEPVGRIRVLGRALRSMHLQGDTLVACIDEVPAIAAAAAIAGCELRVDDAGELRNKESDRIAAVVEMLCCFGARVRERRGGFTLSPQAVLHTARVSSRGDHRLAMASAMLALCCAGESVVDDVACVATSYPDFADHINDLTHP